MRKIEIVLHVFALLSFFYGFAVTMFADPPTVTQQAIYPLWQLGSTAIAIFLELFALNIQQDRKKPKGGEQG